MQINDYGLCDVVDHILPLSEGGAKLDEDNLQPLCNRHHNGLKRKMERYARSQGLLSQLRLWCRDPASRPLAIQSKGGRHGASSQV